MSTLDASSTAADILASCKDNASYAEDASVTKAKAYLTALKLLAFVRPAEARQGNQSWKFDSAHVQNELRLVKQYIARHSTNRAKTVIHPRLTRLRD